MTTADPAVWLPACRRIAEQVVHALKSHPTSAERSQPLGIGGGGDETLLVDVLAERIVLDELERLAADGHGCTLVSEELGEQRVGSGEGGPVVVVDPIDGSLNAKRGLPYHCIAIAVAAGRRMGDVELAFVRDLATGEEWTAVRGQGARLDGRLLDGDGLGDAFELVLLEATTRPATLARAASALEGHARRVRVLGSLALSLCQLASGRADGLATLAPTRAVDIAAAQLVLREAGGYVTAPTGATPFDELPLDLARRARIVAAGDGATALRLAALIDGALG